MRRWPNGDITYEAGDPVVIGLNGEQVAMKVLPPGLATRKGSPAYRVREAGGLLGFFGKTHWVSPQAIIKQADTGGVGFVKHLE